MDQIANNKTTNKKHIYLEFPNTGAKFGNLFFLLFSTLNYTKLKNVNLILDNNWFKNEQLKNMLNMSKYLKLFLYIVYKKVHY